MPLTRLTAPSEPPISSGDLAEHLRLPVVAPETEQSAELARLIEAATTALERRLDSAFVTQQWRWTITDWREAAILPLSPVQSLDSINLTAANGTQTHWTGGRLRATAFDQRLACAFGHNWPAIPTGGHAEITFTAGYGTASEIPPDLRQAIRLFAAHLYENREAVGDALVTLPLGVAALIAPYRPIRL